MAHIPHRKKQTKKPSPLPKDFLRTVGALLEKQFADQLSGSAFLVFGDLYPSEVVLGVSLCHPKSLAAASLHVSSDLPKNMGESPEKVTERLKGMVDVAASWFFQCLQGGGGLQAALAEMADSVTEWQEIEWEGAPLFVKLDRTNYALERAAADFLKKQGFGNEGEDPLDDLEEGPAGKKLH